MGLLSAGDLQQVYSVALDVGLAGQRGQLLFSFAPAVVATLNRDNITAAEQLASDLKALNNNLDKGVDGYLFALWLGAATVALKATRPQAAAQFLAWQQQVAAVPPQAPALSGTTAGGVIQSIQAEATGSAEVQSQVDIIRGYIEELARAAQDLMVSKRLHDRLHVIQLGLPIFRSTVSLTGVPDTLWKPIARQQARGFRDQATGMAGELSSLPADHELGKLGTDMVDKLQARVTAIDDAVAVPGPVALASPLLELRAEVRQQMEDMAARVEVDVKSLQLTALIRSFEKIRELVDKIPGNPLATTLAGATGSLTSIAQDLASLSTQHRAWQNLDSLLWWTEDFFYSLSEGAFPQRNFESNWRRLADILVKLAGDPPQPWFADSKTAEGKFLAVCPLPVTLPLDATAGQLFEDFIGQTRQAFYKVDRDLKASCDRLGGITQQLKDL